MLKTHKMIAIHAIKVSKLYMCKRETSPPM